MPELTNENKKQEKKTTTAKKSTTSKSTTKPATKKATTKKVDDTKKTTKKTSTAKPASEAKKTTAKSTTKSTSKKETTSKTSKTTTSKAKSTTKAKTSTPAKASTKKASTASKPKSTTSKTTKKETVASKAVKEAKEKVVKENLKKELDKVEVKKSETKVDAKVENKVKKEETIIQKIKNFIAKIVAMQEEARKESENKKALQESLKEEREIANSEDSETKTKYMLEYYDLPYRYNETVVKILAQTPKRLFVYWDISDSDRDKFKEAFGENFFETTYPVLLVHNEEMNYTFEVPINDFANSWYLDINDPKSKYVIQLGRKFKAKPEFVNIAVTSSGSAVELKNDYVPITTSNVLEVPNDHILFEKVGTKALYRNVKTNEESYVEIANSEFMKKMGNIYSIYDLYKEIYKNELGDGSLTDLLNPSSMSSSGTNSSMFR